MEAEGTALAGGLWLKLTLTAELLTPLPQLLESSPYGEGEWGLETGMDGPTICPRTDCMGTVSALVLTSGWWELTMMLS